MTIFGWFVKYWGRVLFAVFIGFLLWGLYDRSLMNRRAKYTIGYITGWHPTAKSGVYNDYRFMVNDSVYEGSGPSSGTVRITNGLRFVAKFDSVSPGTNVGYFEASIPDSIQQAPANGWRKPPFPIPQWILDRGKEK